LAAGRSLGAARAAASPVKLSVEGDVFAVIAAIVIGGLAILVSLAVYGCCIADGNYDEATDVDWDRLAERMKKEHGDRTEETKPPKE